MPSMDDGEIAEAEREALAPFQRASGKNPFAVHEDLKEAMQKHVGIMREEEELKAGLKELERIVADVNNIKIDGPRHYNAGWHESIDMRNMLVVSEAMARAALIRKESRGAHARVDYPDMDKGHFSKVNLVSKKGGNGMEVREVPLPEPPDEIKKILEEG
jgi:succinate dehydrogenase / fumarate reductase flavoprotein subunit